MPNQFAIKGAQPSHPPKYAPLWTSRFYDGIVTQASPFSGGMAGHIEVEFYGPRNNRLIDGLNVEISPSLTMIRRPGQSVYNSQLFPVINRFYENRTSVYNGSQTAAQEYIQVIADTAATVYDATGPNTKTALFTKTTGAGSTYFQSVGNTMYFTDGPDRKKYITPSKIWAANQSFEPGDLILDSNGNIQQVAPQYVLNISTIQILNVSFGTYSQWCALVTFASDVPWAAGTEVTFTGITGYQSLNGKTLPSLSSPSLALAPDQALFAAPTAVGYGPTADTGTGQTDGTSGTVTSGGSQPTWNATVGGFTTDNQITWQNFGNRVYDWAPAVPVNAPTLIPNPQTRQWTPDTQYTNWYSILDSNGNIQLASIPTFPNSSGSVPPKWSTQVPNFTQASGVTPDGTISWQNCGPILPWTANTAYQTNQCVLDTNQNLQIVTSGGGSGSATGGSAPAWNTALGGTTTDGTITWTNIGPGTILASGQYEYAYSYHAIDGSVTTSSSVAKLNPASGVLGPAGSYLTQVNGLNSVDPQVDQIWLWRTVQGGSVLLLLDQIPNPNVGGPSQSWSYFDYLPDTSLDTQIEAPISNENDPPPKGGGPMTYHLGRVWMGVGSAVYFSEGPDVSAGNGATAWNPSDVFVFPSTVWRLWATTYGLFVFTSSGVYIIQGTTKAAFFSAPFAENISINSYDAFAVNGSIIFLYTSDNQVLSFDPNGGASEVGFPIGDQFGPGVAGLQSFTPSNAQVTWHVAGSQDKGLYLSNSSGTYWRLCPTPAPETGLTWSPKAQPVGGFSAVQSVETSPGIHQLLFGPPFKSIPNPPHLPTLIPGPILTRDYSVYTDNGASYDAWFILGSLVLAQPGQFAAVSFITTDAYARGSLLTLAVQLDEIAPYAAGHFETLNSLDQNNNNIPDPTQLSAPASLYAQRFYLSQTQQPAWCRHMQIRVNFGTDTVKNELLSITLFGGWDQEL